MKSSVMCGLATFWVLQVLTALSMIGQHVLRKTEAIREAFTDAFSSELGVVVLDDLHQLVEFMKIGTPSLSLSLPPFFPLLPLVYFLLVTHTCVCHQ